eukprot:TRINITY_DN19725_c0_g1_i3.p1 TRINITY_DN19725_c0_g1~~TRINITY_DN19725_c0_g1_i3.p1  ORF type:complete len:278 (+),score=28.27 TRINITY_DN19725_c0_g1_i3:368-1201(+)
MHPEIFHRDHATQTDWLRLTRPCNLGDCDVFLSHSWHDDADLKWAALESWCDWFQAQHGRTPTIWLDLACIDQNHIDEALECLPVFLAACQHFVILTGHTYVERLWCVLELFVYLSLSEDHGGIIGCVAIPLGRGLDEQTNVAESWTNFSAWNCKCSIPDDMQRLTELLSGTKAGIPGFEQSVLGLGQMMLQALESKPGRGTDLSFTSTSTADLSHRRSIQVLVTGHDRSSCSVASHPDPSSYCSTQRSVTVMHAPEMISADPLAYVPNIVVQDEVE